MSGIFHLSLNNAGMKALPNARGTGLKGNYCGRDEARAGSCASLPGPMDVAEGALVLPVPGLVGR